MEYALEILWYERRRYLPAVFAVAFSALLISVESGLLLGMLSFATLPIDHTHADIWLVGPALESIDLGSLIPESFLARVAADPEVDRCEVYLQAFSSWSKRDGSTELCMVHGSRLKEGALGLVDGLTPELRARLAEPGAVVIDELDCKRLGVTAVGDSGEIAGQHVRVVGMVHGVRGLMGARVFCSISTAQQILELPPEQTIFLLARCRTAADAPGVVRRLRTAYSDLSAYTTAEFAWRTQLHWVTKTKAGIALGFAAALGLLVGAAVTNWTLKAATLAAQREYAMLRALGIPRWRLGSLILAQSCWVGLIGALLALPIAFILGGVAEMTGVKVMLPLWLLATTIGISLLTAFATSLSALRLVRQLQMVVLFQ